MGEKLLEVRDLKTYFPISGGLLGRRTKYVRAVDGISFDVYRGETLGLVGESGCGKSTTGRTIMGLIPPTAGEVIFDGKDIFSLKKREMLETRKEMQMIFQDPFSSLNPRKMVKQIIGGAFEIHMPHMKKPEREREVEKLLEIVGLNSDYLTRYPHEFSGGQRQRIGIARALALKPKLIIADEPVSALDVSIQSQVLNLLNKLQKQFSLTYIFIAHDLSVVRHLSDRVGVMYLGKVVELADGDKLYRRPLHPYTKALLSAIPIPQVGVKRERIILEGDVPSPISPPYGCRFHTRCPYCIDICMEIEPNFKDIGDKHYVACHLVKG
ncbi:MAG: dipeptide ABC transporter ATP-binding protein [Clostridia bacterium]|nr:dipeptide ABC transporter ATP-binding protein [Clostridia bacterium]